MTIKTTTTDKPRAKALVLTENQKRELNARQKEFTKINKAVKDAEYKRQLEYFAGLAMQGLCAAETWGDAEDIAQDAVNTAVEMIKCIDEHMKEQTE